jgi:hypothetical protein
VIVNVKKGRKDHLLQTAWSTMVKRQLQLNLVKLWSNLVKRTCQVSNSRQDVHQPQQRAVNHTSLNPGALNRQEVTNASVIRQAFSAFHVAWHAALQEDAATSTTGVSVDSDTATTLK